MSTNQTKEPEKELAHRSEGIILTQRSKMTFSLVDIFKTDRQTNKQKTNLGL